MNILLAKRILVVAATLRELAPSEGWLTLECGVGPVEAAARTAEAIARLRPLALVHVGIAGARRASGLAPLALVIGKTSVYSDLGVPAGLAPAHITAPQWLVDAALTARPLAPCVTIATSGRVGGSRDGEVEAMEGFAVLRAAALASVPAIEIRAISNIVEEPDRAAWKFDESFDMIVDATAPLVAEVAACLR